MHRRRAPEETERQEVDGMTVGGDLERQLETAYAAIEEIDDDLRAGRISQADHEGLRARAEKHAAQILAELQRAQQPTKASSVAVTAPTDPAGRNRSLMIGAGAVLLFVAGAVVGVVLDRAWLPPRGSQATQRDAAMPPIQFPPVSADVPTAPGAGGGGADAMRSADGGSAANVPAHPSVSSPHVPAGGAPPALSAPSGPPSPKLVALDKELQSGNPPTSKILAFARLALEEKQRGPALAAYKAVLSKEPRNAEAITGIGVILHEGSFIDQALARFDQALAIDPKLAVAHWHRAQILFEAKQDYAEAAKAGEAYLALAPRGADAERARALVTEARQRATTPSSVKPVAGEPSR
jgi:tetratricopeptide (TPR) repeat protein